MKQILDWKLCLVIWLSIVNLSNAQNINTIELADDEKLLEFRAKRFTLPNLHITPNGESIIFDVLGDIYKVPIEGGRAEVLLQDNNWKRAGKLSPDGKTLAYISDETGEFQVWTMNLKSKQKRVYPTKESLHYPLYGYWDSNNRLIIPDIKGILRYNENGEESIIRRTKKHERTVINTIPQQISVSSNGDKAYIKSKSYFIEFDLNNSEETIVDNFNLEKFKYIDFYRFTPNGNGFVGYTKGGNRNNILFYKKLKKEKDNVLIENESMSISSNLRFSFDFIDDRTIVLDKEGEIVRMDIETGEYEPIPIEVDVKKIIKKPLRREPQYIRDSIITASVLRNPITRKDLDTIYFGAFGKLHSYSKNTEQINEFYPDKDRFEASPSLSSDGKYLAYSTWNDVEMGHIYTREIKTGKERQLTKIPGRYINPIWNEDDTRILFLSDELVVDKGIRKGAPLSGHIIKLSQIKLSKRGKRAGSMEELTDFNIASAQPNRYYSSITLDKSGERIFFIASGRKRGVSSPPELIIFDLKNKNKLESILLPYNIDEVSVAPNGNFIAFVHSNQIFIDKFPFQPELNFSVYSDLIPEKFYNDGGYVESIDLSKTAVSIYEVAPSYLYWQDENILMWGSAEEIYTYDVRTGKTEKIADIKVQKPRDVPKSQYALTNARIITMNKHDEIIEKGTILIKDNRLERIGDLDKVKIPEDYEVFDLKDKTIIPGLIDVHAHYTLFINEIQLQEANNLLGNLVYGVTTIYEPSVNTLDTRELSQMIEIGQIVGPRVFSSGNIIMEKPNQYDYKQIHSLQDAERQIKSLKKIGVHGPVKEYSIENRQTRKWIRAATEKHKMTLTTDQNKVIPAISRILDGYSAIEHLYSDFVSLQNDYLKTIRDAKIHYTPTLITSNYFSLLYNNKEWKKSYCNYSTLKNKDRTISFNNINKTRCESILEDNYVARNKGHEDYIKKQIDILKYFIENGGIVSVGAHGNYKAGINTHWEMWSYTLTGLVNYEALKAATINGAKKLDLHKEIGSIENGKLADLVILDENPLDHIYNSLEIDYTIINGMLYKVE